MPVVSVIIPVYNTEPYLSDCLLSVLGQSFGDFEVIAVDDGSTDASASILKEFADKDSRIRIVSQENQGLSEARNAGIDVARGQWLTFVDSDDKLAPDFLQTLLDAVITTGADIACSGKRFFWDGFGPQSSAGTANEAPANESSRIPVAFSPIKALTNALFQNDMPDYSAWNKIYAAQFWKHRRFPAGIYFEDVATIPQVFLEANRIAFVSAPLYLYRKRSTSILATAYDRKKAELLDIAESVCDLVKGKGKEIEQAAASNLFSAGCSILKRTPNTEEFADYRDRAWNDILATRRAAFAPQTRLRNKVAAVISLAGMQALGWALRRFG
ncbi:MAG: glycosyltransferase [Fibrobacter sp.]|uniref:glycosyltransferase family 2 protein n=1 Tax=Fibrobacter sp. TaxID=35828 RepID=UPI0025C0C5DA|nr:glycosyltransferase [Fibrobacter sp.]MBR4785241.1 glycosyltransferase [Fibrobacter sp.]